MFRGFVGIFGHAEFFLLSQNIAEYSMNHVAFGSQARGQLAFGQGRHVVTGSLVGHGQPDMRFGPSVFYLHNAP